MSIEKNRLKNGESTKKTQCKEFLHIDSACVINPREHSIQVYPYNINGYRDKEVKVFYDLNSYDFYLEGRSKKINKNIHWKKNKEQREKNMRIDYSIRQKINRSILMASASTNKI